MTRVKGCEVALGCVVLAVAQSPASPEGGTRADSWEQGREEQNHSIASQSTEIILLALALIPKLSSLLPWDFSVCSSMFDSLLD